MNNFDTSMISYWWLIRNLQYEHIRIGAGGKNIEDPAWYIENQMCPGLLGKSFLIVHFVILS